MTKAKVYHDGAVSGARRIVDAAMSILLTVLFAYVVFREKLKPKAIVGLCLMAAGTLAMALWA